jgi:hypothetical protein
LHGSAKGISDTTVQSNTEGLSVLDQGVTPGSEEGGYVDFWEAGTEATGEFHCAECGYGVTVQTRLPTCPMCAGHAWERSAWSSVSRLSAWPL